MPFKKKNFEVEEKIIDGVKVKKPVFVGCNSTWNERKKLKKTMYKINFIKKLKEKIGGGSVQEHSSYVKSVFTLLKEMLAEDPDLCINLEGLDFTTEVSRVCNKYIPVTGETRKVGGNRIMKVHVRANTQNMMFGRIKKVTKYVKVK